jgi:hypothetical protein
MAMNFSKAMKSLPTQIGGLDFVPCRSAPAYR